MSEPKKPAAKKKPAALPADRAPDAPKPEAAK